MARTNRPAAARKAAAKTTTATKKTAAKATTATKKTAAKTTTATKKTAAKTTTATKKTAAKAKADAKARADTTKRPAAKPATRTTTKATSSVAPSPLATDSERAALRAAMEDYARESYPIVELRFPRCACGSDRFQVQGDDTDGVACRRCIACKAEHLICDSAEFWDDAEPEQCFCTCESGVFQVGVGFARTTDGEDLRWIYVGMRCVTCGLAGVYLDWKIDYGPSLHLVDRA